MIRTRFFDDKNTLFWGGSMAKMDLGVKEKETTTSMASDGKTSSAFSGNRRWLAGRL